MNFVKNSSDLELQLTEITLDNLFVCVEFLRSSQPNGVMLSVVLNNTFTGQT